jgi:hypothetical protein
MKTDKEYEKLIKKEFGLSASSVWYRRHKWKLETNKEVYDELQKDVEVISYLQENLIEDKSHHKIKECFKEKNDLILARQFVSRIYSQDLSRPIQNQIRQTARVVYDYLKRLDEVK